MKKIFLNLLLLLTVSLFGIETASAQMAAAKRVAPMVERKVILNAPAEKVWEYVSEPVNYKKFSGVREFTGKERCLNEQIELVTQAGHKRNQYISFLNFDRRRICYFVTKSDYDGDNQWVYSFDVFPKGKKKCELVVGLYHGDEPLPEVFEKGITQEFDAIIAGVSKKFK